MITTQSAVAVVTIGAAAEISARTHQTHWPSTLLRRLLDTVIESRMSRAEREIREHLNLVPDDVLRRAGSPPKKVDPWDSRLEQRPSTRVAEPSSGTGAVPTPSPEREARPYR